MSVTGRLLATHIVSSSRSRAQDRGLFRRFHIANQILCTPRFRFGCRIVRIRCDGDELRLLFGGTSDPPTCPLRVVSINGGLVEVKNAIILQKFYKNCQGVQAAPPDNFCKNFVKLSRIMFCEGGAFHVACCCKESTRQNITFCMWLLLGTIKRFNYH